MIDSTHLKAHRAATSLLKKSKDPAESVQVMRPIYMSGRAFSCQESWSRKFGQLLKWIFCLTAAKIFAASQE
jgi:hypothetical protein